MQRTKLRELRAEQAGMFRVTSENVVMVESAAVIPP